MPAWHEQPGKNINEHVTPLMQESRPQEKPVSTQSPMAINTPHADPVEKQQKTTGGKVWNALKTAGWTMGMVMGPAIGAGIVGYAFYPEKYQELKDKMMAPFKNSPEEPTAAPSTSTDVSVPKKTINKIPQTPAELLARLKKENLLVNPDDFPKKQFNMNALMLAEEPQGNGPSLSVWKKIEDKKSDLQNILIVTKVERPENTKFMSYMYYEPVVAVEDETDPRIKYHLFECSPEEDRRKRGAAIVLKQKGRYGRDSLIANADFIIPYCEKKAN